MFCKIINGDCNRFYVFFVGTKVYLHGGIGSTLGQILETIVVNGGKRSLFVKMQIMLRNAVPYYLPGKLRNAVPMLSRR